MTDENGPTVDLLGDPWTEAKDPRGRKRHKRSKQVSETIAVLRASGATEEEIAARVLLDGKTLRKYYSRELAKGPALARAVLIEGLWGKAKSGNVSAARVILAELGKGDARLANEAIARREKATPAASAPEGKKAQAKADADAAVAAEGKFAPRGGLRLAAAHGQAVDADPR
jgi:hypothetical protein